MMVLGTGKSVIANDEVFDNKYDITVPRYAGRPLNE
jgi:hypothetical protein